MRFNLEKLRQKAERLAKKHGGPVSINLPFVSFTVDPDDAEKKVARELLIRLPDRRVLSSKECCDNCIDNSLDSIQDIRRILVDKQVDLSHLSDGALYLLIEYMTEAVRQFLTLSERLQASEGALERRGDFYRLADARDQYFSALEALRFHLHSCLTQVSAVADMSTPKVEAYLCSQDEWQLSVYEPPQLISRDSR